MGASVSHPLSGLFRKNQIRILMVGLDAAGKTTILYMLKLGEIVTTTPTCLNIETVRYKNVLFNVRDMGGQDKIRCLWRRYFIGSRGIIFVIDSSDRDRVADAQEEIQSMFEDHELHDAVLLVLANKQDLSNAMTIAEITDKLSLRHLRQTWYVQAACATSGDGLLEGLEWLSINIKPRVS